MSPYSILNVSPKSKEVKMSPRMGRPPSNDPKSHETRIRMSDRELEMLEICCQKTGMTKANVIRKGIELVYKQVSE